MSKTVLLIEDDAELREHLALLLSRRGADVVAVNDGREALEWLRKNELPALILLDLMLPVLDGWRLRRQLRADPRLASIPIVLVSAVPDLALEAKRVGAVDYLQKPVELPRLFALVDLYCAA